MRSHQNENPQCFREKLVGARGLEPPTPRVPNRARYQTEPRPNASPSVSNRATLLGINRSAQRLSLSSGARRPLARESQLTPNDPDPSVPIVCLKSKWLKLP